MLTSPNLSLDYIDVNAAQREVVHNAALRSLDALVQLAVLDRDLATPPGSPSDGHRWIVAASPTGAWAGHATHVAAWQDGAWHFYTPRTGWFVYVVDEGWLIAWNGSAWVSALAMLTTLQNLALLGVGTTADATNPFSAKLNNTLWVAKTVAEGGDGNLRYKLSKESAAKTLSLLLQDNFSGRAEIGLTGDDDLHVKVSSDGSTWIDAVKVAGASGAVAITAANALALAVGRLGATNPALQVDASASSCVTGLKIAAAAAGSRLALAVGSSATDEGLSIDGKGAGTIRLGATSTGAIEFGRNAVPTSNDGAALGTTLLMWSDLFLASGAVINFNNGNATLTHSSGLLTLAGGKLALSDTTASTSSTTGSLTTAGGIGVAGAGYFAGNLTLTSGFALIADSGSGNNNLTLKTRGSGAISFVNNSNETYFQIAPNVASGIANYMQWVGNIAGANPYVAAQGTDSNVGFTFLAKGSGSTILFAINGVNSLVSMDNTKTNIITGGLTVLSATLETNYAFELPNSASQKAKANAWDTYSDARLKRNFGAIEDPVGIVMKMRPLLFDHYDSRIDEANGRIILADTFRRTIGFVAQDEIAHVPWLVSAGGERETWGFDYAKVGVIAIAVLQNHEARLAALESRLQ